MEKQTIQYQEQIKIMLEQLLREHEEQIEICKNETSILHQETLAKLEELRILLSKLNSS